MSPPEHADPATHSSFRIRVLLVEDDEPSAVIATFALAHFGCDVLHVRDGESAVRVSGEQAFDLILMDYHLPRMNGLGATGAIRGREAERQSARVAIVGLSASAVEEKKACLYAGMDEVLQKPFQLQQLKDVVERWSRRVIQRAP